MLKAVAHPLRLRIVALLCGGPQNVNAIAERMGAPQSIVSQQLRILRLKNLVDVQRRDGFAFYELVEMRLQELIRCMEGCS